MSFRRLRSDPRGHEAHASLIVLPPGGVVALRCSLSTRAISLQINLRLSFPETESGLESEPEPELEPEPQLQLDSSIQLKSEPEPETQPEPKLERQPGAESGARTRT